MNIFSKAIAAAGLAAFSMLAALPVSAQYYHPIQRHHAARLNHRAAHAAYNGNYRRAARLHAHAARLRHAANHGY